MIELDKHEPNRVTVNMGFTRNMQNFESLRIDVGLEAVVLDGESSADAMKRVYTFVESELEARFSETEEALREAGLGDK